MSKYLIILLFIVSASAVTVFGQDSVKTNSIIKPRLVYPFGTVLKMKVEIVDGQSLNDKGHASSFLLKVKSIDSVALPGTIIMEFRDETDKFPNETFGLYKYLYGKKTGSLSSGMIEKMKKKYVGREFSIVAYETGGFTGFPVGYFEYQPLAQGTGFYFKNYLVIIASLTSTDQ